MKRRLLLSMGSLSATILPIGAALSCGSSKTTSDENEDEYIKYVKEKNREADKQSLWNLNFNLKLLAETSIELFGDDTSILSLKNKLPSAIFNSINKANLLERVFDIANNIQNLYSACEASKNVVLIEMPWVILTSKEKYENSSIKKPMTQRVT